jgi:hypothetical protein
MKKRVYIETTIPRNCHFLLTWNCRHLANASKFDHIRFVNSELGLFCPILTTPVELLGYEEDGQ